MRFSPRSRGMLSLIAATILFAAALLAWTLPGRTHADQTPIGKASGGFPSGLPNPAATASSDLPTRTGGASAGPSQFPTAVLSDSAGNGPITTGAGQRVTLSASSDTTILRLLYYVRRPHPYKRRLTQVASPPPVTKYAQGAGVIAEIWMQGSSYATRVSCSISVNGVVRSQHTSTGPYAVAVCIA